MGEPIKIGHHSEKRHRALMMRNWNRMAKSVEFSKKSEKYKDRASYWESKTNKINLSDPESIQYYTAMIKKAEAICIGLKNGTIKREHSFSLPYATKNLKEFRKNLEIAEKLWA